LLERRAGGFVGICIGAGIEAFIGITDFVFVVFVGGACGFFLILGGSHGRIERLGEEAEIRMG
jgi:hypothetical protein